MYWFQLHVIWVCNIEFVNLIKHLSYCQVKNQGVTEELRCLGLLNALDKDRDIPEDLAQLFGEPCIKLAEGIKAYISKVSSHLGFLFYWLHNILH